MWNPDLSYYSKRHKPSWILIQPFLFQEVYYANIATRESRDLLLFFRSKELPVQNLAEAESLAEAFGRGDSDGEGGSEGSEGSLGSEGSQGSEGSERVGCGLG